MSNYINVLRRLERERRVPAAPIDPIAPVAPPLPTIVPTVAPMPIEPPSPVVAAPAPAPIVVPESTPVLATPSRTVIPLPSAAQPAMPPARALDVLRAPTTVEAPIAKQDLRRSRAFATETHPGIAMLLDKIRTLAGDHPTRTVVFCGASTAEAVANLADSLATHAMRTGLNTFVGTLTRTTTGTFITAAPGGTTSEAQQLGVDLDAGAPITDLRRWVEHVAPTTDLAVITGPPLATSLDAALLACACDGLVIVAESEKTERAALQVAAERARIAGCRTLGVVMHGAKDRVPGWIRRLVGDRPEPHLPRED